MKKKSKKKLGFTLLETVISMAIIAILSVGVYNAYIMLIRNTKDGEVKQEAALLGKRVIEEIKSGQREPNDEIIQFDKDGNITDTTPSYKVHVDKESQQISISSGESTDRFFIGKNKISQTESDVKTDEVIKCESTIFIDVDGEGKGKIKFENGTSENDIDNINNVALDLKYLTQDSKISVIIHNVSNEQLNLYLWNSKNDGNGNSNVKIKNTQGNLNKCYRSDSTNSSRSGELYKITVTVDGKNSKGIFENNIFNTEIYQNIS